MKNFGFKMLLAVLVMIAGLKVSAQTYDIYIANRALTSNTTMEFDVFIKNNGSTGTWALRSYQCGYQFSSGFVNGGTLSAQYVTGSTDMDPSFSPTWGFSYNSTSRVINQSANVGSTCPGSLITGTTARKIGRFRITNSVNWGCADDNVTIRTSGTGFLLLAVTKYNSTDCSDLTNSAVTSGATSSTVTPNSSLLTVSATAPPSCLGTTDVTVSASGGVEPYSGTGVFARSNGTYSFTVTDNRGCSATASITVSITPITSSFSASGCSSYLLPWGQTVTSSGSYSNVYTSFENCDSTVTANITINSPSSSSTSLSVCNTQLPYTWNGQTLTAAGTYTANLTNAVGCDSTATLILSVQTASVAPTSASASSSSISAGSNVTLTVNGGSLGTGANWFWYTGTCGGTAVGTGASITVTPSASTTYFVRAENSCGTTSCASVSVSVSAPSCVPSGITSSVADNILCSGRRVTLTVEGYLFAGASWRWHKGTCSGTIISKTNTVTVSPSVTTTYYVRQVGGPCGSNSACASITITVVKPPTTPGSISGQATGLCNATNVTYTCPTVTDANSYTWYVPTGATIVSGQGTNAVTVSFSNNLTASANTTSSQVCVVASNQCGSSSKRCHTISLISQTVSGTIAGPASLAQGTTGTYTISPVTFGATGHRWAVPSGWQIVSGQGTNTAVIKAGKSSGNVRAAAQNSCGLGSYASYYVTVTAAKPGTPEAEAEQELDITVWPVPTTDVLFLKYNGKQPHRIELLSAQGKLVLADKWTQNLNLRALPSGMYILRVFSMDGRVQTKRIQVVR